MEALFTLFVLFILVFKVPKWIYQWYKNNQSWSGSGSSSTSPTPTRTNLPQDIYQAIEKFAQICHQCKQATGWEYENDYATIRVVSNGTTTKLELSCHGDCIALRLPSNYKWLYSSDNAIEYRSETVTGYVKENYGSSVPTEADSLFYFYKKGDPHSVGTSLHVSDNGNQVFMHISLR